MLLLLTASLLWAFSFGLIGNVLKGVDPFLLAWIRIALSLLIFLPGLRLATVPPPLRLRLIAIGAVQFGLMYMTYLASFRFLPSHEIAILTITTPLYVTLLNDWNRRRFHAVFFVAALVAMAGSVYAVLSHREGSSGWARGGFLLVQTSNLCFAWGQMRYRSLLSREGFRGLRGDTASFAWLYLGALLLVTPPAGWFWLRDGLALTPRQMLAVLYLGVAPSGIGFFLWNAGARRVNAGSLAVMNNLKIPLAVLVSLWVFRENVHPRRLLIGGLLMIACILLTELWSCKTRKES
jgi:drug/metabolite transporter (DMT)-like permease